MTTAFGGAGGGLGGLVGAILYARLGGRLMFLITGVAVAAGWAVLEAVQLLPRVMLATTRRRRG
jgi:hypothetical protein